MNLRTPRALTLALVTAAAVAVGPAAVAEELPPPEVVGDCIDQVADGAALEEARLGNEAAKSAFTSLRGPMTKEVKQLRAEARATAKAARAELRASEDGDREAARAQLRESRKAMKASHKALVSQVKSDRRAAKAAWDEAKAAYHALLEAYETCYGPIEEPEELEEPEDVEEVDATDEV